VLGHDVVSPIQPPISAADILGHRSISRIRRCRPNLYTMPQLHHGLLSEIAYLRRSQTGYLDNVVVFARLEAVRGLS
jgi:hypothetical protein